MACSLPITLSPAIKRKAQRTRETKKEKIAISILKYFQEECVTLKVFRFMGEMPLDHKKIDEVYPHLIKHKLRVRPHFETKSLYDTFFKNVTKKIADGSIIFFLSSENAHIMDANLYSSFEDIRKELKEEYEDKWSKFLLVIWVPNTYLVGTWFNTENMFEPIYLVKFFVVNVNYQQQKYSLAKNIEYENNENKKSKQDD